MNTDSPSDPSNRTWGTFWKSRFGIALLVFLAIGGFLMAYEHRVHLFSGDGLLIGLLVACIAMHLFMHHGHGGRGGGGDTGRGDRP